LITVIGAVGSIGFLLLQWRASSIREQQSDWRTSVLEVQAKKAAADLLRAKANIVDADARAAGAQAEATHATERASALEADAAKARERTATLEKDAAAAKALVVDADARAAEALLALEKIKAPRTLTLEQQARITAAVMPYSGQEYTLSVVPGSEAENLLCMIDAALMAAQWKRVPVLTRLQLIQSAGPSALTRFRD
jgi:hypothetical protein